jgi:prolyl oligopeptidase
MARMRSTLFALLVLPFTALAGSAPGGAAAVPSPDAVAIAGSPASAPEEDPYLWLEDVTGERPLAWVRERNAGSEGELTAKPGFADLEKRIRGVLDSNAKIPYVGKMGDAYYNFWKDAEHPRGLWRRTSWKEFRKDAPAWETVLDVDALGAAEGVSWVWAGASCLPPEYERCLVSLSRGGADATVVREFDLTTKSFVEGGFSLPEAKQDVGWIDRDTLWVGTDLGPGTLTSSGYAREARRWKRGTPIASSERVYAGEESDVSVNAWHEHTDGFERDWIERAPTFFTNERFLVRGAELVRIDKPDDAMVGSFREWMYLELRSDWTVGGRTWKGGSLLAIRLDDFLAGARSFDLLFEPGPRTSLASYTVTRNHVVLRILDNVRSRIEVLTPKKRWARSAIPGLPELGTVTVSAVDAEKSDELFVNVADYITPTTLSWVKIGKGTPTPLKQLPAYFDATGLVVSQHEASSKDGTKIPYFQVSRGDLPLDGRNPTLLYGYGGFEVSLVPGYSGTVGSAWLEPGGVYVVANIRGGGEFGPAWHQAALKQDRNKAYEDFAAVAEDLAARKVTSREHLGIQGGSNGGLLMGNMLTGWPHLFSAVVCQVPLLDMKRFNKLLAGASWMGEYGNPDIPEEWAYLQNYSPYQKVRADVDYPRVLFTTSTRDDRVHPGHARKMAARMLEQGHDLLYYENIEGGHGGAADNGQAAHMAALAYTFLWSELKD